MLSDPKVAPQVHVGRQEVTLDIRLELSIPVPGSGDSKVPTILTRHLDSSVRLADNETFFVTGLIYADRHAVQPGSSEAAPIAVLSDLFAGATAAGLSEVVVALTPHISPRSSR